jgi:hypothetical protein
MVNVKLGIVPSLDLLNVTLSTSILSSLSISSQVSKLRSVGKLSADISEQEDWI